MGERQTWEWWNDGWAARGDRDRDPEPQPKDRKERKGLLGAVLLWAGVIGLGGDGDG